VLAAIGGYHQRMRRHAPRSWRGFAKPGSPWNAGAQQQGFVLHGADTQRPSSPGIVVIGGGAAGLELETAAALADGHTGCTVRHFLELAGLGREARAFSSSR
jgi:hypothetical protein